MKALRKFFILLLIPFSIVLFTGCSNSSEWNAIRSGKELKIAVLVSNDGYEEKSSFMAGVKLAIEESKGKGYKVSYKFFNDENNFDKGVALAKEIINSKEYPLAFSFQSMDTFDTVAKLFEEAKKPLFTIDGADDRTMQRSNKYIFNLQSSAENLGLAAGKYALNKGYQSIAIAHANNSFSLNFIEGFNDAFDDAANKLKIVDIVRGPNKEQEIPEVLSRWSILNVDAVVLSFADESVWGIKLASLIRAQNPNIAIIADPYFDDTENLKKYEKAVDGIVIPSDQVVDSTSKLNAFYSKYKSNMTISPTPYTAQGFDLVNMIVSKMQDNATVDDFINAMKSNEAYQGVSTIKFNVNGVIEKAPSYVVVKNGTTVNLEV